jgi:signal transduction histidine kinase/CheY-like chemotaxis protein
VRAAARLVAAVGEPENASACASRLCQLARELLGAESALLVAGSPPMRLASLGAQPPFVPSLGEVDRVRAWAAESGLACAELVVLPDDGGLFAIFRSDGECLDDGDCATLAAAIANHLRVAEARHAQTRRVRTQAELARAERNTALGEMALCIAHDFNNVLNAMLAQIGAVERLTDGRPEVAPAVARLRKTALDGATTVERIQHVTRQGREQMYTPVAFSALVEDTARALAGDVRPDVRLDLRVDCDVHVQGNAGELVEVLGALVDNALAAMPEGGTLTVELTGGEEVQLVVADTGVGMSREVRRRAFDPFFTTRGGRRKGLGLSLALGIARRHGGHITLDSSLGAGTRVRVRLPSCAAPAAAAPMPETRAATARAAGRRVLLVEDDPDNREAMAALLELAGFDVTCADTGDAGVRAFVARPFDLVLTDLGLPDINGWQVASNVKASAPTVPVALITGWGFNLDGEEVRRRGVDLLVKKPIDPRRFVSLIETLIA